MPPKPRFVIQLSFFSNCALIIRRFNSGSALVSSPIHPYSYFYYLCPSLSVQRLRILQQKKEAQAKASRRDIATLLERGKIETARVKVENSTYIYLTPQATELSGYGGC
jgi:hypothetical protein